MLIDGNKYAISFGYTTNYERSLRFVGAEGGAVKVIDRGATYDRYSADVNFVGTEAEMLVLEAYFKANFEFTATLEAGEDIFGADTNIGAYDVAITNVGVLSRATKLWVISCRLHATAGASFKGGTASIVQRIPLEYSGGVGEVRTPHIAWEGDAYALDRNYTDDRFSASYSLMREEAEQFRRAYRVARGSAVTLNSSFPFFGSNGGGTGYIESVTEIRESYSFWRYNVVVRRVI